jgi:hypothetical protein
MRGGGWLHWSLPVYWRWLDRAPTQQLALSYTYTHKHNHTNTNTRTHKHTQSHIYTYTHKHNHIYTQIHKHNTHICTYKRTKAQKHTHSYLLLNNSSVGAYGIASKLHSEGDGFEFLPRHQQFCLRNFIIFISFCRQIPGHDYIIHVLSDLFLAYYPYLEKMKVAIRPPPSTFEWINHSLWNLVCISWHLSLFQQRTS